MNALADPFLSLCFEAAGKLGIQVHAVTDPAHEVAPDRAFCRIGKGWHLYLPDWYEPERQRLALIAALAKAGGLEHYLPPLVREAVERYSIHGE